jgi:hypothetical protein
LKLEPLIYRNNRGLWTAAVRVDGKVHTLGSRFSMDQAHTAADEFCKLKRLRAEAAPDPVAARAAEDARGAAMVGDRFE